MSVAESLSRAQTAELLVSSCARAAHVAFLVMHARSIIESHWRPLLPPPPTPAAWRASAPRSVGLTVDPQPGSQLLPASPPVADGCPPAPQRETGAFSRRPERGSPLDPGCSVRPVTEGAQRHLVLVHCHAISSTSQ